MPATRDKLAGCMIGLALGDALGFPVEGEGPAVCAAYARDVVTPGKVPLRGADGFPFGQYSDDTQLARELLRSWRDRGGFDAADYAARIACLFAADAVVGRGRATEQAAERLIAGTPWFKAGTPPPSAGNGSAMRAGPLGVLLWDDADAMVRVTIDQGRITHADPRCMAGSVAVAGAVALAASDGAIDPKAFLAQLQEWTGRIEPSFESALRRLQSRLDLPADEAAAAIARDGLPPGVDSQWRGGISAFVVGSVLWSLWAFLNSPDDWLGAVALAIRPGGDVDTTGAMTGAMAGARLGLGAIPEPLARTVTDRGTWGYDELVALAGQAFDRRWAGAERRRPV